MKVLVADKFEDSGRRGLAEIGCDVVYEPDAVDDKLLEAVEKSEAEVLIVRSTKVNRAMLERGKLALVIRAGAGVNTIDVEAALDALEKAQVDSLAGAPGRDWAKRPVDRLSPPVFPSQT